MQVFFKPNVYPSNVAGYNGPMPKTIRTARVHMTVTDKTAKTVRAIADALSSSEAKWSATDVYEAAVECLATRKDVRDALAAAAETKE